MNSSIPGLISTWILWIVLSNLIFKIISEEGIKGWNPECTKVSSKSNTKVFLFWFKIFNGGKNFSNLHKGSIIVIFDEADIDSSLIVYPKAQNENVKIDYNRYNELIKSFVKVYSLDDTVSTLTLRLHISILGDCEDFEDNIHLQ